MFYDEWITSCLGHTGHAEVDDLTKDVYDGVECKFGEKKCYNFHPIKSEVVGESHEKASKATIINCKRKKRYKSIRHKMWKASKKLSKKSFMSLSSLIPMELITTTTHTCSGNADIQDIQSSKICLGKQESIYFDALSFNDDNLMLDIESSDQSKMSDGDESAAEEDSPNASSAPTKRSRFSLVQHMNEAESNESNEINLNAMRNKYQGTLLTQYYCEPSFENLRIRGKTYLMDKIKIPALAPRMTLVGCDLLETKEPVHNIAKYKNSTAQSIPHDSKRPLFIVNFIVPGSTWISLVLYFQSAKDMLSDLGGNEPNDPFATIFERFRNGNKEYRDNTFKIIPQVIHGPWILQRSVGAGNSSVPVILGRRLSIDYFCTNNYVEVDINVHSNAVAASITKMVRSQTQNVVIDISILLEGKDEEELPEYLLGLWRLDHMKMSAATKFDPSINEDRGNETSGRLHDEIYKGVTTATQAVVGTVKAPISNACEAIFNNLPGKDEFHDCIPNIISQ